MNFLKFKKLWPILVIILAVIIFFRPFLFEGKLPIPSDTIIGLYHPFRDLYAKDYPRGIPFKNFLITDPVRQQYPWRELAVDVLKKSQLPLWNPYSMAGYPLLGNVQSAALYPLNILFFLIPFSAAWSILIFLQPLLAGIFLYLYLRNLNIRKEASLLGSISFAFSGFSIAWMEWGTVLHSALWLPLILLAIDRIFLILSSQKIFNFQFSIFKWAGVFVFSLVSSFFAGHLQTFFYVFLISFVYLIARWWQHGRNKELLAAFIIYHLSFIILTAVQWIPTLQLILESARSVDRADWRQPGWFIPWQHLVQFIAPDFFGNPTTLNYWGVWNYGELVGYIGILPLMMALFALIARRDKKTLFFGLLTFISLLFALPTIVAKVPYILNIPLLATAQPTRLLFVMDFSLVVLAALGFDLFLRNKKKIWYALVPVGMTIIGLWLFVFLGKDVLSAENLNVATRNLLLPTLLFFLLVGLLLIFSRFPKTRIFTSIMYIIIVGVTAFDLIRFGWKFTPFTNQEYLFPSTQVIDFLQAQDGQFRIMATDDRILPPNFSTVYRLQTVNGYDPLYLRRYGELIAASERGEPNISPPFGFNRIITPKNYESKIIDLLGVKYVLSLSELNSEKLVKVFQEGETRVYENKDAFPRVFFVDLAIPVSNQQHAIDMLFEKGNDLRKVAVYELEGPLLTHPRDRIYKQVEPVEGYTNILMYSENKILIETESNREVFLILTDSFYPTWRAKIDGNEEIEIKQADYNFRGINVPGGKHTIEFFNTL